VRERNRPSAGGRIRLERHPGPQQRHSFLGATMGAWYGAHAPQWRSCSPWPSRRSRSCWTNARRPASIRARRLRRRSRLVTTPAPRQLGLAINQPDADTTTRPRSPR
jgi:hypothetical protein